MATVGLHATVYRAHARSTSGCPRIQIQYRIQHRPQAGSSTSSTGTKNETRPLHPLLSLFVKIAWQDLPFGIRRPVSSDVMLVAPAAGILALQVKALASLSLSLSLMSNLSLWLAERLSHERECAKRRHRSPQWNRTTRFCAVTIASCERRLAASRAASTGREGGGVGCGALSGGGGGESVGGRR